MINKMISSMAVVALSQAVISTNVMSKEPMQQGSVSLSSISNDKFKPLTKFIEDTKNVSLLDSGTAVAIVKDGRIIYQHSFGYSDIAEKKQVSKDTSFYVASTTKPFYALSTLIDIDNSRLKADTTLATLFQKNGIKQLSKEVMNQVTVRDLLVHGSGIENEDLGWAVAYTGLHDLPVRRKMVTEKTVVEKDVKYREFNYSNFGYNLLSVWHDDNHQLSWQETIQKNVYAPLNMTRTTSIMSYAKNNKQWDVAKPYSFIKENNQEALYLEKVDKTMHSAGGMVTSSTDMAQMVLVQLGQGKINGKQLIPANIIKESQVQQIKGDGKFDEFIRDGYAWGWFTGDYKGERMLHHLGGFAGTHALISFIPAKNVGIVILNNEGFLSRRLTGIASSIAYDILLGKSDGTKIAKEGFEKIKGFVRGFPNKFASHIEKINGRPWLLTNPKNDYVGTYNHPLLGNIKLELDEKGVFQFSWGQLKTKATAFTKQDTMRVEFVMYSGSPVQFEVQNKKVSGLVYEGNKFNKVY